MQFLFVLKFNWYGKENKQKNRLESRKLSYCIGLHGSTTILAINIWNFCTGNFCGFDWFGWLCRSWLLKPWFSKRNNVDNTVRAKLLGYFCATQWYCLYIALPIVILQVHSNSYTTSVSCAKKVISNINRLLSLEDESVRLRGFL